MSNVNKSFGTAAYGGDGWVGRQKSHLQEIGDLWSGYAIDSEWRPLKAVLVHEPGDELLISHSNPEDALMLEALNLDLAKKQHQNMCKAFEQNGVEVVHVRPKNQARPNQMFCADQMIMTPQGAILARPAGQVRAGEEVEVARRLADLGIPILRTLTGDATFEGADMMWIDETTAMIGRGHRTNQTAIDQISDLFFDLDYQLLPVDMPFGTMHFMGMLRVVDKDLAICWPRRTPLATVRAMEERGYQVIFPPFEDDGLSYRAMNIVTLGPRKIMISGGLERFESFFKAFGIECVSIESAEISKAAGNVGCLTAILAREMAQN